ncbi:MAG: hypothetical protein ACM37W_01840 [Actinomycetota bacterium]
MPVPNFNPLETVSWITPDRAFVLTVGKMKQKCDRSYNKRPECTRFL